MARWIEVSVSILECDDGHITPHLTFCGDTDMVTAGLGCLSSIAGDEILVAEMESSELSDETGLAFESRISVSLNRDDLRFTRLCGVAANQSHVGTSFKEFQLAYSRPILKFSCSKCGGENAKPVKCLTLIEYEERGGKLTVLPDLKLVSMES